MRNLVSTVIAALIVGALAGATVGAVAQDEPTKAEPAALSNINADKVDGRHAVGSGASKAKRAGKLVATNSKGYLPSNIVKPYWGAIKNKPAGFADGKDNAGVTSVTMQHVRINGGIPAGPGSYNDFNVNCPAGYVVTGGGFDQAAGDIRIIDSSPNGSSSWYVHMLNLGASAREVSVYAICMNVTPRAKLTIAGK